MKRNYNFSKGAVIKGLIKSKSQVEASLKDQQKTLTSIRLDKDIVEIAKQKAEQEGIGYLTWLNMKLRKAILSDEGFEARIKKLEKAIFKKKASGE